MEVATDIASAQALWLSANNTCGFNRGVGRSSGRGATSVHGPGNRRRAHGKTKIGSGLKFELSERGVQMFGLFSSRFLYPSSCSLLSSQAVFFDMDPRELNSTNGGDPRPSALYRTNHGFDPETIAHYTWNGEEKGCR